MQMLLELVENKLLHNYINDNSLLLEKRHSIKPDGIIIGPYGKIK